jgi:hypothetical protein
MLKKSRQFLAVFTGTQWQFLKISGKDLMIENSVIQLYVLLDYEKYKLSHSKAFRPI